MVVSGTKKFPTKDSLKGFVERYGGASNASTGTEIFNVYISLGDPSDYKVAVEYLSETLQRALFKPEVIETERGAILSERGMMLSNPERALGIQIYRNLFFQGTAVEGTVIGSEQTLHSITREDLLKYREDMLIPSRMMFLASGDLEIDLLKDSLEASFNWKPSTPDDFSGEQPIIREKPVMVERFRGKDQVFFMLGFRTVPETHPDQVPLALLASTVGQGGASSLMKKLRYETGLVYHISAAAFSISDGGTWQVSGSVLKQNTQQTIELISEEFHRITSGKLSQSELDHAKARLMKSARLRMQTSEALVSRHTFTELLSPKSPETIADYLNLVEKMTLDDLHVVGKKYLKPGQWYLGMTGDILEGDVKVGF
jgi:predicted Zn-dependent peptidase